jgi:hypothetical protein
MVAIAQREALAVGVDGRPELVEAFGAVHGQSRLVGIGDRLVRLDQDHALAEAGDDLPEFMPVNARRHDPSGPRLRITARSAARHKRVARKQVPPRARFSPVYLHH